MTAVKRGLLFFSGVTNNLMNASSKNFKKFLVDYVLQPR